MILLVGVLSNPGQRGRCHVTRADDLSRCTFTPPVSTQLEGTAKMGQLCWLRGFLYLAAGGKGKGFMWEWKTTLVKLCWLGLDLVTTVKSKIPPSSPLMLTRFPEISCPSEFSLSSPHSSLAHSPMCQNPSERSRTQELEFSEQVPYGILTQ